MQLRYPSFFSGAFCFSSSNLSCRQHCSGSSARGGSFRKSIDWDRLQHGRLCVTCRRAFTACLKQDTFQGVGNSHSLDSSPALILHTGLRRFRKPGRWNVVQTVIFNNHPNHPNRIFFFGQYSHPPPGPSPGYAHGST